MKKVVYLTLFVFAALFLAAGFITSSAASHTVLAYEPEAMKPRAYLPLLVGNPVNTVPPTPTPPTQPPTQIPAALAGTWYNGSLPPIDFYDPITGEWGSTNGLGQMYKFEANGNYVYAGFLRLQNGQCLTEVSTYKQGQVQSATAQTVTLKPQIAKTRTVVVCGSNSDTTTDGPYDAVQIGWQVKDDGLGHLKLTVDDGGQQPTEYYKDGMAEVLAGSWSYNGVSSAGFYNPHTGAWATPANDGAWFHFKLDGTYQYGEYGHNQDNFGCNQTYWIYQAGKVNVSGGRLSYQAQNGRLRVENECNPVRDEPYVDPDLYEFTWEILDGNTAAPRLGLSPLGQFNFIYFDRE